MSYTYKNACGSNTRGDYACFAVFEHNLATKPFGLVQRTYDLKRYFCDHPNTGGKNKDGRVVDTLCRIDAMLRDKTGHEYPLLTPIVPMKFLYNINADDPHNLMVRVDRWARDNKRSLCIGELTWDEHYKDQESKDQKLGECIDVLLTKAKMTESELIEACNHGN